VIWLEILLAHLVGDYVIQSHWMAQEKTKRWWPAAVHAATYGIPYGIFVTQNGWALAVIVGTHAVIDRYRLARYVVWAKNQLGPKRARSVWSDTAKTGYPAGTPDWLAVWLMIICDNTLHLVINTAAVALALNGVLG